MTESAGIHRTAAVRPGHFDSFCNTYQNRRRVFDAPARPPSCVAWWGEEAVLPLTQVGERSVWCARGHPLQ